MSPEQRRERSGKVGKGRERMGLGKEYVRAGRYEFYVTRELWRWMKGACGCLFISLFGLGLTRLHRHCVEDGADRLKS